MGRFSLDWCRSMMSAISFCEGLKVMRFCVLGKPESSGWSEMQPTQRALHTREVGSGASKRPSARLRAAGQP